MVCVRECVESLQVYFPERCRFDRVILGDEDGEEWLIRFDLLRGEEVGGITKGSPNELGEEDGTSSDFSSASNFSSSSAISDVFSQYSFSCSIEPSSSSPITPSSSIKGAVESELTFTVDRCGNGKTSAVWNSSKHSFPT